MQYSIISALSLPISIVSMCLVWDQRSKIKKLRFYIDQEMGDLSERLNSISDEISHLQHNVISQAVASISKLSNHYADISERDIPELKRDLKIMRRDITQNTLELDSLKFIKRSNAGGELCSPSSVTPMQKPTNQTTFADNTLVPQENVSVPSSDIPLPSVLKPFQDVLDRYQNAVDRNDRKALRQMQLHELNIAAESESLLSKADFNQLTKLETVVGGGSYIIIGSNNRYWLFPTAQTLDGFSLNQPRKGVFLYESSMLPKPVVKEPAEVREDGIYWLVIHQGSILVPR